MKIRWSGLFGPSEFETTPLPPAPVWTWPAESRWQKCPVCVGRGHVPAGFYTNGLSTSTCNEKCRACEGKGMVR